MVTTRRLRWVLLGSDTSWGARILTGQVALYVLAIVTLVLHALDVVTGVRMMLVYGVGLEQNPIARGIMLAAGPLGLIEAKFLIVGVGLVVFLRAARHGRARLARNCLLLAAALGALGFSSNLV